MAFNIDPEELKYPVEPENLIPGEQYYGIYITYDVYPKENDNLVLTVPSFHGTYLRTDGTNAIFNNINFLPTMPLYQVRKRIDNFHFYSSQKPLATVINNKAKQLAVMNVYEQATGLSGLPQDGPVKNILGYADIGRSKGFKSGIYKGGACGACSAPSTAIQSGGGCGCQKLFKGGYNITKRNRNYLKRWKQGKSIGFTMTSSLKAKGLIPRTSRKNRGKKVISPKYK